MQHWRLYNLFPCVKNFATATTTYLPPVFYGQNFVVHYVKQQVLITIRGHAELRTPYPDSGQSEWVYSGWNLEQL